VSATSHTDARRALQYRRASQVTLGRVSFIWAGLIPLGAMTMMAGEGGVGMMTLGVRVMSDVTRGTLSGEFFGRPRSVIMVAPEDGVEDVLRPRFEAAGADLSRVFFVDGILDPSGRTESGVVSRVISKH